MRTVSDKFIPFADKMKTEGLPDIAIRTFMYYYRQLMDGDTGIIAEKDIMAVDTLPDLETFNVDLNVVGNEALPKTILLKLNGGLGTSMGLDKAKSLLKVNDTLSFLDIVARQAAYYEMPLVLMNSFVTHDDSLKALQLYSHLLQQAIPLDFIQDKVPKITQKDFNPGVWKENPNLEWCPPGHGNIYTSLVTTGMLDSMLNAGYEYAFISNADNLGAVMDKTILGYFVENQLPFMMEVADRTQADKKGGHLAKLLNGQMVLRELAQCSPGDNESFQNIELHKYFNTNNIWINLPALQKLIVEQNGILGLPMICNSKNINPRDNTSTPVYQLETAIGAAISIFKGAGAIRVPRSRFAPVKTTEDLLAVRSNAYILTDDCSVVLNPKRKFGQILINLDSNFYKLIDQMESRFLYGVPSLIDCKELTIKGDVQFGQNVSISGNISIVNNKREQIKIPDGQIIEESLTFGFASSLSA